MTIAIMINTLPISNVAAGVPRQIVCSGADGGTADGPIGAVPAGDGRPQWGQVGAIVETSRPQSGQAMTGMPRF
jgi:hypothetical protein